MGERREKDRYVAENWRCGPGPDGQNWISLPGKWILAPGGPLHGPRLRLRRQPHAGRPGRVHRLAPGRRHVRAAGVPASGTIEGSSGGSCHFRLACSAGLPLPYPSLSFRIRTCPSRLRFLPTPVLALSSACLPRCCPQSGQMAPIRVIPSLPLPRGKMSYPIAMIDVWGKRRW
jgi:hypothetical protein